ncbi:MAG: hypothetical protein AAF771_07865 [Pseudomonadota bacterium]
MSGDGSPCCGRHPTPKETTVEEAAFDSAALAVLEVARYYWQTFAIPQSQSWLCALQRAETRFPGLNGVEVGLDTLAAVQAMRMSRTSCFNFNNPGCPHCSLIVSEHERQFMNVLQAVRQGRVGAAKTHAMILCEGNDTERLIMRMVSLARALTPEEIEPVTQDVHPQLA